jgi:hypothetical protein
MAGKDLEQRVRRVAETTLAQQQFVSVIDVLLGLGWLAPSHLDLQRQGRVDSLERVVQANLSKVTTAMTAFRRWAQELLMSGVDRETARDQVRQPVEEVLDRWRDRG